MSTKVVPRYIWKGSWWGRLFYDFITVVVFVVVVVVAVLFTAAKICSKTWRNCIYNKGFCFMRTLTYWNWHLWGKLTSITWLASTMILMSLWAILQSSRVTKVSEVPFLLQEAKNSRTKCKFVSVFNRMIETCCP